MIPGREGVLGCLHCPIVIGPSPTTYLGTDLSSYSPCDPFRIPTLFLGPFFTPYSVAIISGCCVRAQPCRALMRGSAAYLAISIAGHHEALARRPCSHSKDTLRMVIRGLKSDQPLVLTLLILFANYHEVLIRLRRSGQPVASQPQFHIRSASQVYHLHLVHRPPR
jgi:hypothetical protein